MRRAEIRETVEAKLAEVGFPTSVWDWNDRPAELVILVGYKVRHIAFRSGVSKRAVMYECGRIHGWAEACALKVPTAVKRAARSTPKAPAPRQIDIEEAIAADVMGGW